MMVDCFECFLYGFILLYSCHILLNCTILSSIAYSHFIWLSLHDKVSYVDEMLMTSYPRQVYYDNLSATMYIMKSWKFYEWWTRSWALLCYVLALCEWWYVFISYSSYYYAYAYIIYSLELGLALRGMKSGGLFTRVLI